MATKSTNIPMFESLDVEKNQNVEVYLKRFKLFCSVQKIQADMKVTHLLASIGGTAFEQLETLLTPNQITECTLEEISKALIDHYQPKSLTAVERHNFRARIQAEEETFSEYLAALKKLSKNCGFKDQVRLDEELVDQIIKGLHNERTRSYFLSTPNLTLENVVNKALADEKAKVSTDILKNENSSKDESSVSKINVRHKEKLFHKQPRRATPRRDQNSGNAQLICYRCGKKGHNKIRCRIDVNIKCFNCNRTGHMAVVCRDPKRGKNKETNLVYINGVNNINENFMNKWFATVQINNKDCRMEVNTGSPISLISVNKFRKIAPEIKTLEKVKTAFVSYTKNKVKILGKSKVTARCKNQVTQADIYIVDSDVSTLLGREWLQLNWSEIQEVRVVKNNVKEQVNVLIDEFTEIFNEEIGCLKDVTANIEVKVNSQPIHLSARTVPYALVDRVNAEIDRLEQIGVLERVKFAEWATPIVPIVKANAKDIRICGDYKVTINKSIVPEHHPIPHIEQILASMHDARFFAKFDIREAYLHIPTNEETADLLTITTPKGLYRVKRMLYGITNAPAIWQRTMDDLFKSIPGVCVI